jgi:hypothetical protein
MVRILGRTRSKSRVKTRSKKTKKTSSRKSTTGNSRVKKTKKTGTKQTKKVSSPRKIGTRSTKFKKVLNKVMKVSVDVAEQILPFVLKAAKNVGYKGAIGTGVAALSLLFDTKIGREAARLMIAKTKDMLNKSESVLMREAYKEVDDFMEVEEEIIFDQNYYKPTLSMVDARNYPYRGVKKRDVIDRPKSLSVMNVRDKRRKVL